MRWSDWLSSAAVGGAELNRSLSVTGAKNGSSEQKMSEKKLIIFSSRKRLNFGSIDSEDKRFSLDGV